LPAAVTPILKGEEYVMDILCYIVNFFDSKIYDFVILVIAFVTLLATIYIPRRIRVDQEFSALTEQYRSPEMGFAILSIFDFYQHDCQCNHELIKEKYIDRYKNEIGDELRKLLHERKLSNPAHTLHFQRRLVAYFYWDMAKLYVDSLFPRLTRKQIKQFIEPNERNLISLVLQMGEANKECFAQYENVIEPPDDDVQMNQLIKRLYDKAEEW
jgi:hypothetical protein